MNSIVRFLDAFLKRSGSQVLLSTILSRGLSFFASWIALQLIPNKEFGIVLFAYNIILFILPFSGLGLYQSLIRYAPFLKMRHEKMQLFSYVLKKGLQASILLFLFVSALSFLLPFEYPETKYYLIALAFILIPDYIFQLQKIQFRILHKNKSFALLDILYNVILLVSVYIFCSLYEEKGYIIALILAPAITSLFYFKRFGIKNTSKPAIVDLQFWKYGFYSGLTSVVSQLLVSIDILIIGIMILDPKYVTDYKYISIFPMSMLFLSNAFMATDFVTITERILNKIYLKNYIVNYIFLFSSISIVLCILSFFFGEIILSLFDQTFTQYKTSFFILTLGISSILTLRGLFGNLLCSIGKITINLYISIIAVILNIIGNYMLIPKYGIKGAAITSATIMWFTSILSAITFFYLYKNYTKKAENEKN